MSRVGVVVKKNLFYSMCTYYALHTAETHRLTFFPQSTNCQNKKNKAMPSCISANHPLLLWL